MSRTTEHGLGLATVVFCPGDQFPRGSLLPWIEFGNGRKWEGTMEDGYWPLGMVLEYCDEYYVICGDGQFWKQQKQEGYPYEGRYPEQKLRKIDGEKIRSKRPQTKSRVQGRDGTRNAVAA